MIPISEIYMTPFCYGCHLGLIIIPIICNCIVIRTKCKFQIPAQSKTGDWIKFYLKHVITDKLYKQTGQVKLNKSLKQRRLTIRLYFIIAQYYLWTFILSCNDLVHIMQRKIVTRFIPPIFATSDAARSAVVHSNGVITTLEPGNL